MPVNYEDRRASQPMLPDIYDKSFQLQIGGADLFAINIEGKTMSYHIGRYDDPVKLT